MTTNYGKSINFEGKAKAGLTPSFQNKEKSKELKEALTEQVNKLGAKNEVAAKPETRALPSNPDEEESEGMKELATEQKNKIGEKNEEAGISKAGFISSV